MEILKLIWCCALYVAKTIRHKVAVVRYGRRTRASLWRLIRHDLSKFGPSELPHYARQTYGPRFGLKIDPCAFACAWNHHHKHNDHHWEYWIPVTSHMLSSLPAGSPLPMPIAAVREMVADWLAASSSYSGRTPATLESWTWFHEVRPQLKLHLVTWGRLDRVLSEYFGHAAHLDEAEPSPLQKAGQNWME